MKFELVAPVPSEFDAPVPEVTQYAPEIKSVPLSLCPTTDFMNKCAEQTWSASELKFIWMFESKRRRQDALDLSPPSARTLLRLLCLTRQVERISESACGVDPNVPRPVLNSESAGWV